MKMDGRNITHHAQDLTEAHHRSWTWTHAHTHTHGHRCNYLSNASCDFLGVNELINIREKGEGERGLADEKLRYSLSLLFLLLKHQNDKMGNYTLGDTKH